MMNGTERRAFLAHSKTRTFKGKLSQARDVVSALLELGKTPYIAFSAGKDSTVCLHITREQAPNVVAVHMDHEWLLPETRDLLDATQNLRKVARTVEHCHFFTSYAEGKPENLPEDVEWSEHDGLSWRKHWPKENGFDAAIIGLRADENGYRRVHIRSRGQLFPVKAYDGMYHCLPVAWWSDMDIWAYIASTGAAYNKAYDKLGDTGVPLKLRRIGPFANERVIGRGQLNILRKGWPEVFAQFVEAYPEARRYA